MPLLNYTTTVPVAKTVAEMHSLLVQSGARRVVAEYSSTGQPTALGFVTDTPFGPRHFILPADTSRAGRALADSGAAPRFLVREHVEKVAWRILKDWLEAQLALLKIGMVTLDQVMLPYMAGDDGRTVYDLYRDQQLALPPGSEAEG